MAIDFICGFESGDALEARITGTAAVQSTIKRSGAYALRVNITGSGQGYAAPCTDIKINAAHRFYFYAGSLPSGGEELARIDGSSFGGLRLVLKSSGIIDFYDFSSTLVGSSDPITAGTWNLVTIGYKADAAPYASKVEVNGVSLGTSTSVDTGGLLAQLSLGRQPVGSGSIDFSYDDYASGVYTDHPLPGGRCTSSRQGVAGTPSFDAYTKTGAATAALCWSNTPSSSATNCNTATSAASQSMLCGAFSTATNAPPANATLNGICIGAVGLTSSATSGDGNAAFILKASGSTTTSGVVSLGTTSTFISKTFSAPAASAIDSLEIGVSRNTTGIPTHTIHDVWGYIDWSLVITITQQPSSQVNLAIGASTTLSVTAINATSYQWQDNSGGFFADIVGATSSSYTTPAMTATMEGRKYRCVLNATGADTAYSAATTLRVTVYGTLAQFDPCLRLTSWW